MKWDTDSLKLIFYNQEKDSMLFKDEAPNYLVEFAKNKMLITGYPSHNYIVHDWEAVSVL